MNADDTLGQIADLVLSIYQIHEEVLAQTGGLPGLTNKAEYDDLVEGMDVIGIVKAKAKSALARYAS